MAVLVTGEPVALGDGLQRSGMELAPGAGVTIEEPGSEPSLDLGIDRSGDGCGVFGVEEPRHMGAAGFRTGPDGWYPCHRAGSRRRRCPGLGVGPFRTRVLGGDNESAKQARCKGPLKSRHKVRTARRSAGPAAVRPPEPTPLVQRVGSGGDHS